MNVHVVLDKQNHTVHSYYSDTVYMDAFIITMALPARVFQHGGSSSWSSRDLLLCIVWDEITYPFLNFNGETVEV